MSYTYRITVINMVIVESKAKKWGNSVGFIIPKDVLKDIGVEEGETLEIDIRRKKRINGFGLFRHAKPFIESDEHNF